jgi:hypothetical protein
VEAPLWILGNARLDVPAIADCGEVPLARVAGDAGYGNLIDQAKFLVRVVVQ